MTKLTLTMAIAFMLFSTQAHARAAEYFSIGEDVYCVYEQKNFEDTFSTFKGAIYDVTMSPVQVIYMLSAGDGEYRYCYIADTFKKEKQAIEHMQNKINSLRK